MSSLCLMTCKQTTPQSWTMMNGMTTIFDTCFKHFCWVQTSSSTTSSNRNGMWEKTSHLMNWYTGHCSLLQQNCISGRFCHWYWLGCHHYWCMRWGHIVPVIGCNHQVCHHLFDMVSGDCLNTFHHKERELAGYVSGKQSFQSPKPCLSPAKGTGWAWGFMHNLYI